MQAGCVYLVGAGPGDPELLTLKALRVLREADVVIYDRLVSDAILALLPPGVMRIYVGKESSRHSVPQDQINERLVKLAKAGRRVVRLKGGDPFVFGRGSEEAEELVAHGIPFEVVPGITSASACSAYAGIPLTHRGLATGVRFVTGHCRQDAPLELNWASLADPNTTLAIYMGTANADVISDRLIAAGLHRETPVALIENGTTPRQRVGITTLSALPAEIVRKGFKPPTLIVIGKVVTLAETLAWAPSHPAEEFSAHA
jgi:uroporphyrin-III C-methyltransferase/precorrin-2 dehydrogenase/sirohydrochlorin ferrochelatase/uroporphyrin-III C-methyltransferase